MIVTKLNGVRYDLNSLGITLREFSPQSPSPVHSSVSIEGMHGEADVGTVYGPRIINCSFYVKARDSADFPLLRDEVFALFDSRQSFYITEQYNPEKRWLVKSNGDYSIDQKELYGFFDIDFISYFPFSESVGTTLNPFTTDAGVWQVGQGLQTDEYKYVHTTRKFSVYNAGIEIDPRQLMPTPLNITYKGSSKNLVITNETTGDTFKYYGTSSSSDSILLSGVQVKKNSASVFGQTNRKLVRLAPGWNQFSLSGIGEGFKISFDFRFYYL
ncbi:phage tail family protein [Bacillus spizizenii]|uniref:phage tail family protein n=1 Tax=Bacillus spizizenii TaxID=96241 RepID=UPI002FCB5F6C